MTDTDRCPVHPSVERVEAAAHDHGRVCPRCEADRARGSRVAADGGHELTASADGDADEEDGEGGADPATPRIDDAVATLTRAEHVYTEATVEVSGGVDHDGDEYFQTVDLRVRAGEVTVDVELTRPAAAGLRAELEDALTEAAERAAAHR